MHKRYNASTSLTVMGAYIPILIGMVLTLVALIGLPTSLADYRQRGWLPRFSVRPVAPAWLLAAQVIVNLVLASAAVFAIGLWICAVAPIPQVAAVIGSVLLYPLLFFSGMWGTRQALSPLLQTIGDYTPLGAAAQAMQDAMAGSFPTVRALLVMTAYAVVFTLLVIRLLRWE